MKHSDKMVNFLRNKKTIKPIDLPFGCPECGSKFVSHIDGVATCGNGHSVKI